MLIYTWPLFYFMWQHYLTYVTLHLSTPSTVYVLLLHVTLVNGLDISTSSMSCDSLWHLSHRFYSLTLTIDHAYVQFRPYSLRLQLTNTSLNGGNVCLATLPSSDRDYNSSTTSTWTLTSASSLSVYTENIMCIQVIISRTFVIQWSSLSWQAFSMCSEHREHSNAFYFVAYKLPPHVVYIYNFREHFRIYFIWTFFRSLSYETVSPTSLQPYPSELAIQWTCSWSFLS
jgi:hypothetical protein